MVSRRAFLFLWVLSALPGALFIGGAVSALALVWLGLPGALVFGTGVGLLLVGLWVTVLPALAFRRVLARLELTRSEAIERSWGRAFDGVEGNGPDPELRLLDSSAPSLMVFKIPFRQPLMVVSSGWIFKNGEEKSEAELQECGTPHAGVWDRTLDVRSVDHQ